MKRSTSFLCMVSICFGVLLQSIPGYAGVLFSDDFESGDLSSPLWGSTTGVKVSSDRAVSGIYSARFKFQASSGDSFAELRFDLENLYPELWIKYKLYFPTNYVHRDLSNSSNNHKFFRLWGKDYSDKEKVGATMWEESGYSNLKADWATTSSIGPKGEKYRTFVTANDLDKWMDIKIHVKAATATKDGTIRIWKNGTLIIDNFETVNNYRSGEAHAYRYGYLLGWASSGFAEDTYLYIDDVVFSTRESDLDEGTTTLSPPTSLRIIE